MATIVPWWAYLEFCKSAKDYFAKIALVGDGVLISFSGPVLSRHALYSFRQAWIWLTALYKQLFTELLCFVTSFNILLFLYLVWLLPKGKWQEVNQCDLINLAHTVKWMTTIRKALLWQCFYHITCG